MKRKWGALIGFLWVQICWVRGVKVEQSPSVLSLQEGANSTLRCNFSDTVNSVQWFQQNTRGSLTRLFFIASGTKKNERMSSTVNSKERYSTLHITASQLEDSATYLCVVEAQCSQAACSLYPNCSCLSPSPPQYYTVQTLAPMFGNIPTREGDGQEHPEQTGERHEMEGAVSLNKSGLKTFMLYLLVCC
ncbi:TPA: hypothetical protein BOS_10445 [Bos taurus]|nr:TPA: hypothetical protein BOS_10445 [Bos taurus]